MNILLSEMKQVQEKLLGSVNLKFIKDYFKNEEYLYIFITQFKALVSNLVTIDLLLEKGQFEDSMTIFRKFVETFFIILSIIENPSIVNEYILHNKYLAQRACNENTAEIRRILKENPENFIEYGYLKKIKEEKKIAGKYSINLVAKCANVPQFYEWYRLSSNFVHNNLTSLVYDEKEGILKLKNRIKLSVKYLIDRLKKNLGLDL
jgi:hypothetical protein